MKFSPIPHGLWCLTALATFCLGYVIAKSHDSQPPGPTARLGTVIAGPLPGGAGRSLSPLGKNAPSEASGADPSTALSRAALTDPAEIDALTKDALNDPNPITRQLAFAKLLASLTPENVDTIREALQTHRAGGEQRQLFLYAWGAMDSAGALAHAETLEGPAKARFLQSTLPGWASKDPAGAIAWVDKMGQGDPKNRMLNSLVGGLADHDLGMATSYVLARAASGDRQADQYMQTVTGEQLRKNGPAASIKWGEQLPDSSLKTRALEEIADSYVKQDPTAAAAWAEKYATASTGGGIVEEVSKGWAERDPDAAVAWLNTLSDGPAKSEGTYSALREWTRRDPTGASQYLAAQPASDAKDSAVSGFARSLAREDPESAIIWAKTIGNEASRTETLTRAGQSWFRRDPAAAATWLQSANLPEATQQAILNPPRDDRRRG